MHSRRIKTLVGIHRRIKPMQSKNTLFLVLSHVLNFEVALLEFEKLSNNINTQFESTYMI